MDVAGIVQTVLAAHQVGATHQQRAAEVHLFNQLKEGDIRSSATAGSELTQPGQPLEAQILGYGLLQYLVGARWDDFPPEDLSTLPNLAYNLLQQNSQGGAMWVVRSKAAALLALVIKRSGPEFMKTALAQLVEQAQASPVFQEAACLVLRYLLDDVVQFTEDLQAEALRQLLTNLTAILVPLLQFVERTIESNFAEIAGKSQTEAAPHVAAVQAALSVAESYAEWAPVSTLRESGLVTACGYLLRDPGFKTPACQVLFKLAERRLTANDNPEGFSAAMQETAEALIQTANGLLAPESNPAKELDFEGDNDEFGLLVCDAMAVLGTGHITQAAPDPARRMAYLKCMLAFAQHPYLLLADKSLVLWAKLLQDAASLVSGPATGPGAAPVSSESGAQGKDTSLREAPVPPEAVVTLMQLAAEHLQQRNPHVPQSEDDVPPYFDSFEDYKEFMIGYRLKLSNIVKAAAAVLPQQALESITSRLNAAIGAAAAATGPGPALDQARVLLESAVVFTSSACKAVWDAAAAGTTEADRAARTAAVVSATEPMLQSLLNLRVTDAALLQSQAKGLEAFSRLIAARWDLLQGVVTRVFELLVGSIPLEPNGQVAPPGKPLPGWREGLQARGEIASVLLEYAKIAPQAFLPHIEAIAVRLTELWESVQIRPGERNCITEALLAASMAGPLELQASLAEWALGPVRTAWGAPEFQARISNPQSFLAYYVPVTVDPTSPGGVSVGCQAGRWAIYHQVHLVERAVRRMHSGASSGSSHALTSHMAWAVPTLLQLVSCLNAVHTPAGREATGAAAAALDMSPQERALYLKRGPPGRRNSPAALASGDSDGGDYASVGGTTIGSLRGWLRHMREFSSHTLGLLPTCVPGALDIPALPAVFAPSLFSYMEALSHQHLRLLMRHVTIPYVKALPPQHMVEWMLPQLALVAPHMQQRLTGSWTGLLRAPVEGTIEDGTTGATNDEIIHERMVRELSQEYAELLREVAGRVLEDPNAAASAAGGDGGAGGGGSGAPTGHVPLAPGMGKSSKAVASGPTLLQLLLEREPAAGIAAAAAAVQGMQLPDEAAYRFAMFCRALVALAPRDAQLYSYVGSEVLKSAIASLGSEAMSTHQADILGLIRNIIAQQMEDANSPVHSVLQSLPGVTPERQAEFVRSFQGTGSEKQQRDAVKKFLVQACGRGSFAALAEWRPPSALPAGALRNRGGRAAAAASGAAAAGEVAADEILQGDITRALFA